MATALIPLADYTVTSNDAQIDLTSLPTSGYRDLVLTLSVKMTSGITLGLRLNGDSGTNYRSVWAWGKSTGIAGDVYDSNSYRFMGETGNVSTVNFETAELNFFSYRDTGKYKNIITRENQAANIVGFSTCTWYSLSAINSISLFGVGGSSFAPGSRFSLYGVTA